MKDGPILTADQAPEPMAYECKFQVESTGALGGDWQRNIGGNKEENRVTFDGYAPPELIAALIGAIEKTVT